MPIYLYRCEACQAQTEELQKMGAPAPAKCPSCGAEGTLKKLLAPVGIVFKGTGFHKNDYSGSGTKSSGNSSPTTTADKPAAATTTENTTSSDTATAPAPAAEKSGGEKKSTDSGSSGTSGGGSSSTGGGTVA